jgi:hypothetical protein
MEQTAVPIPPSMQRVPTHASGVQRIQYEPQSLDGAVEGDPNPYVSPQADLQRSMTAATGRSRLSRVPTKEIRDPNLDTNLPYRTLSQDANLAEYTTEVPQGEITGPPKPDGSGYYKLVTFTPGDPANPKNWSKAYKWWCTMVVAVTCFVVAFCSSVITADMEGVMETFHVSEEAALVSITVFVVGFGVGKSWHSTFYHNTFDCDLSDYCDVDLT